MPLPETPEIRRQLAESRALRAILHHLESRDQVRMLRVQVKELVLAALQLHEGDSVEDIVTRVAMRHILCAPNHPQDFQPVDLPLDRHIFEVTAKAWLTWLVGGDREAAHDALKNLVVPKGLPSETGALHLMALQPWTVAVGALFEEDLEEARRMFRRTVDLSSQFGIETSAAIQWTFAASFFRATSEGTPSE